MPDTEDYAELSTLLSHPERWTDDEAASVNALRRAQVATVAAYNPRDTRRIASMTNLVCDLDEAISTYEKSRAT